MKLRNRTRRWAVSGTAALAVAGMNAPALTDFAAQQYHQYLIRQPAYRARYGSWQTLLFPAAFRISAVHATLLRTGKVLIVAGSGNDTAAFAAGTFKSLLWDPEKNTYKLIPTPDDMFCGGHTSLPDGSVLVAGGTQRYEQLDGTVTKAAGTMRVRNENPDGPVTLPKGSVFTAPDGRAYASTAPVTVPAAVKTGSGAATKVAASEQHVFVESLTAGQGSVSTTTTTYHVRGLSGAAARNVYGMADSLTLAKQDFQGLRTAWEFNPDSEEYEPVPPMRYARWYPTLTGLGDGRVLAVSGLDDTGQILPATGNELFDPASRTWSPGPDGYFPTYPTLFLTESGELFFTGSNSGYGPADQGRTPRLWNLTTDTFRTVPGLRDPDQLETSSSVLLPPAQRQRVMVLGGGGVGESDKSTARTAIADLSVPNPSFAPGPDLPAGGTRYLNSVILPDDTVFTTGGSADYRGKQLSDRLKAQVYHPDTNSFTPAADPTVGRDYHSEALLLPDGRVVVLGSNPLFADRADTEPAKFEQRVEIWTPPYLYHGDRPSLTAADASVKLGGTLTADSPDAASIATARLIRPSSVTHVTDVEQRSVALTVTAAPGGRLALGVPANPNLLPPGWYQLFVTDHNGTPSVARWVQVTT
ncbi:galactose oxidase-like domain-containing protein [Kitasatospora viridis]|uniref:Uncharacterized protein DUF1929 n=1 Tax=Kitasatospora viridis TaxID=281105 RepID=A0A561UKF6_9ACTN|nr:galactose oxidase-like domain-containing protein [Kitasatospora viridis]TWF99840.1 uncharacterized protein DUF1929 [Kitasatospora viridis]